MTSSKGFQHHFNIISKFVCCGCYMKKNAAFALISFAVLKWHECLSFQLPFELTVELPVQLHLELEVNLLVCNVIEREIEREKVQMKPPSVFLTALNLESSEPTKIIEKFNNVCSWLKIERQFLWWHWKIMHDFFGVACAQNMTTHGHAAYNKKRLRWRDENGTHH